MTDLNGKTAVITGASRGIGAAIAHMLDDRGCRILETALRPAGETSRGLTS